MTVAALAALPIAVAGFELLFMMLGAAVLGAAFFFAASHLFSDKPVRRRKSLKALNR